jgi:hypothetical protein
MSKLKERMERFYGHGRHEYSKKERMERKEGEGILDKDVGELRFVAYYKFTDIEHAGDRTVVDISYTKNDVTIVIRFQTFGTPEYGGDVVYKKTISRDKIDTNLFWSVIKTLKDEFDKHGKIERYTVTAIGIPLLIECKSVNPEDEFIDAIQFTLSSLIK